MTIDKNLLIDAKRQYGSKAAILIAADLGIEGWDESKLAGRCHWHSEDTPSLSWNEKNDSFHCFGCGVNYDIINHYISHYGLSYMQAVERLFAETNIEHRFSDGIKEKSYNYPPLESFDRTAAEGYLMGRGISPATLDYAGVTANSHGNILFNYYDQFNILTFVKGRPSRAVKKGEEAKNWIKPKEDRTKGIAGAGSKPVLYGMHKVNPSAPLLICEGEIDMLSAIEAGHLNSVSVPFGANTFTWIEYNFDWLEQFDNIIVWSDNDEAGLKMRKEIITRLGHWRCKFVDLPKTLDHPNEPTPINVKDINDVLCAFGKEKVLSFIKDAQDIPVENVYDLSSADDWDIEKAEGLYTGLKPVDKVLYKLVFGSLVVVTGMKGSGKSTFLNQVFVCEALNQGHDVFLFSGELQGSVLKNWLEITMGGRENIEMVNDFSRRIDPEAREKMRDWYRNRVWAFDDSTNNSEIVLNRAVTMTRKYGVKVWLLDNLMTLDIDSENWNQQKDFIVKLIGYAKQYNVLIVLVAHPRKTSELRRLVADDVAGTNNIGNLAQYILGVHRYTEKEKKGEMKSNGKAYKPGKEPIEWDVAVEVFKNRYTGKTGEANLYFDYPSYRFYSSPSEVWKRYQWDADNETPLRKDDPNRHGENPMDDSGD